MTKPKPPFDLIGSIRGYFKLTPYMPIMEWIDSVISYADEVSAEKDKPDFSEYPYQVPILQTWEDMDVRKHVTVVSCEQMRQDQHVASRASVPHGLRPVPEASSCTRQTASAQRQMSRRCSRSSGTSHGLKEEMAKPRAYRGDRYRFSNLISYFQGAGSKIASKSCKIVIADEVDQWPSEYPNNYLDLCKRTRSYKACMEYFVCSPTTPKGVIWQDFLKRLSRLLHA